MQRMLVAGVALLVLAGCAQSKDSRGYPDQARTSFIKTCTGPSGGTRKQCTCAYDKIESRISYDKFKQVDASLSKGDRLDAALTKTVFDAITSCR